MCYSGRKAGTPRQAQGSQQARGTGLSHFRPLYDGRGRQAPQGAGRGRDEEGKKTMTSKAGTVITMLMAELAAAVVIMLLIALAGYGAASTCHRTGAIAVRAAAEAITAGIASPAHLRCGRPHRAGARQSLTQLARANETPVSIMLWYQFRCSPFDGGGWTAAWAAYLDRGNLHAPLHRIRYWLPGVPRP